MGRIRYPGYKTGGVVKPKGLRNKRRAYWQGVRQAEQREKDRIAEEIERRENAWQEEWGQD